MTNLTLFILWSMFILSRSAINFKSGLTSWKFAEFSKRSMAGAEIIRYIFIIFVTYALYMQI